MYTVKTVDEVFEIIDEAFSGFVPENEKVDLKSAAGRVTAVEILSSEDIPGFNRSTVDGFAVISSDTFGASDSLPAQLRIVGEVKMGETPGFGVKKGEAAHIPTGGELPVNCDAVVMIEHTEDFNDGYAYVNKPAAPGHGVIFRGDDVRLGSLVLEADRLILPRDIGALAAIGKDSVLVKKKIKVGIISTGDEVVDIKEELTGSRVRDVNSYAVYSEVLALGAEPVLFGIVRDDYEKIRETVSKALSECDAVLISGGSSVGTRDETSKVIDSFGLPGVLVHGIAIKPGKPTIIGKVCGKAVIGLPGHPLSAFFIFKIFISRLIDRMNGIAERQFKTTKARMLVNYPSNNGREEFVPVKTGYSNGMPTAIPILGKSGLITTLTQVDGYVRIGRGTEGISEGEAVEVVLF